MAYLMQGLGHADRHSGLTGYCTGLMLPLSRQYCGVLGKQDNCQVAVSVTLACEEGGLPVAWQLYLPHGWAEDDARRTKAGVPEHIEFATKPQIALQQIQGLLSEGAPASDATAHRQETTGERQGIGAVLARQRIPEHQLARRQQRAADGPLCRAEGTLRGWECGQGPSAS